MKIAIFSSGVVNPGFMNADVTQERKMTAMSPLRGLDCFAIVLATNISLLSELFHTVLSVVF